MYIFICISGLAAPILDFAMHSSTNNKDISTSESAIPRNRAIIGKLQLVDNVSKMVKFLFSGRHLGFSAEINFR